MFSDSELYTDLNVHKQSCWWTPNLGQLGLVSMAHTKLSGLMLVVTRWVIYRTSHPGPEVCGFQILGLRCEAFMMNTVGDR
jgi:hypothetical protein